MLLISLLLVLGFAQIQVDLSETTHVETITNAKAADENGDLQPIPAYQQVVESVSKHFSDKFYCFKDEEGMYKDWARDVYGNNDANNQKWFCCGYMANGRKQCDLLGKWKMVNGNTFSLCQMTYEDAFRTTNNEPRRDLCCDNEHFQDCTTCKSFVVWDFTTETNSYGGDIELQKSYDCNAASDSVIPDNCDEDTYSGKVTLKDTWRDAYYDQPAAATSNGNEYPPYAYGNMVYPAGFLHGTLREFNDPPVCVYAPNVGGRVIEIRVEPDEDGSQLCVDDLLADTAEKNNPGVTQACDDVRLQTCFPDANSEDDAGGFAFVISCSESCADGDVDLWFRLRASQNRWTEAGDEAKGTDKTEVNTEMWCMWGNQKMDEDAMPDAPAFAGLDGDFSRWDIYPSDLEPEVDPQVRPVESGVSYFSFAVLVVALALLF